MLGRLIQASRIVLLAATIPVTLPAQSGVPDADWRTYNRTVAGDRFSPLTEITRANVGQLREVCRYALPEVTSLQTGPIVIAGVLYFTTDTISYAIDAANCAEQWKYVRHSATPHPLAVHRGFAYLDGRLFRGTSDGHVFAVNASDGRLLWEHVIAEQTPGMGMPMAPIAWNGLVYIGTAGGDIVGVTGHVYALDPADGHVVWRFDVVPDTGVGRTTWTNPRLPKSGGGFWTSFTLDENRGVLLVPAGNPAPDFDIELRTGDNLYTNSVIALDARTGRLLGYNQVVKHDSHDWDVDSPPIVVTTRGGRAIVASANKNGLLSVLDRSRTTTLPVLWERPITTRQNADAPLSRDSIVRFCPGFVGGVEWNGAAYSPQTNLLYVGAVDWCSRVQLKRDTSEIPPAGAVWFGNEGPVSAIFDPSERARGWITAFDAESGTVRWKYQASRPILAGVTPTAGGVVFAADLGGRVYAFDAASGKIVWQIDTGQSAGGGLVTYQAGGRQLVAMASGMKSPIWPGGSDASRIVVYGLPLIQ
jgi:alcohol dehydrogenase (cytochrome c)